MFNVRLINNIAYDSFGMIFMYISFLQGFKQLSEMIVIVIL